MPEDLGDERMAKGVDAIACHTFTKERRPHAMSDLSYLSLMRHPSKVMLRVFLNRLKAKAEELLVTDNRTDLQCSRHHSEAPTTSARSVPQLHRLQEGVR